MKRYIAVLQMFLPVYESLELQIGEVLDRTELGDSLEWAQRRKLATLRHDLAALDASPISSGQSQPISPPLSSQADALGALYVTEGATLGGQYIAPHIKQVLGTEAVTFFEGYSSQRAMRWQQYRRILREYANVNIDAVPRIEQVAVETFDAFLNAYRRTFVDSPPVTA